MCTATPRTSDWTAKEIDLSAYGAAPFVMVNGQVEPTDLNAEPYLCEVCTAEFGPETLVLNLKGAACSSHEGAPATRAVHFKRTERPRKFGAVLILWNGVPLTRLDVARAH